jgi:hypothetical protein
MQVFPRGSGSVNALLPTATRATQVPIATAIYMSANFELDTLGDWNDWGPPALRRPQQRVEALCLCRSLRRPAPHREARLGEARGACVAGWTMSHSEFTEALARVGRAAPTPAQPTRKRALRSAARCRARMCARAPAG